MPRLTCYVFLIILTLSQVLFSQSNHQAKELGTVQWLRNYDQALAQASSYGKPILLLFQEVPGCSTCQNYGKNVLSHPLIVDAIENEFIPLAIYNNTGGHDKKVLEKYGEPTWNNPVVRIIDARGENIMQRLSGNYTVGGLSLQMTLALRKAGHPVPKYLELLADEASASKVETAYYEMYCFWSGEAHLGAKDGVIATEPGWANGAEVVKVTYDGEEIDKNKLDSYATKAKCRPVTSTKSYRIDKDPQYYLKNSPYKYLPLSPIQKSKINAALATNEDASSYLSPTQLKWFKKGNSKKVLYEKNLAQAWKIMER